MSPEERVRLTHIAEAAALIARYVEGDDIWRPDGLNCHITPGVPKGLVTPGVRGQPFTYDLFVQSLGVVGPPNCCWVCEYSAAGAG